MKTFEEKCLSEIAYETHWHETTKIDGMSFVPWHQVHRSEQMIWALTIDAVIAAHGRRMRTPEENQRIDEQMEHWRQKHQRMEGSS